MKMNQIYRSAANRCRAILAIVLIVLFFATPSVYGENLNKSVLYLNSYHDGYQWSDTILSGIRSELAEGKYKIDLQIEYMDTKKFNIEEVIEDLLILYKAKFKNERFDAIIVSDDDAFDFALKYRDEFLPGVPLVFCGVNSLKKDELTIGNITGIVENFDFQNTIDIALKLHPGKKRMVVVGDDDTTSIAIRDRIEALIPLYRGRLQVDYWTGMGLEEVQAEVQNLPEDTFLFFIPYYQVIGDLFYTAEEVAAAIYKHSSVPIYSSWEFLIGHGVVGGNVISGLKHGRRAAEMVLETLGGQSADLIPVRLEVQGTYEFDFEVMKRLGLSMDILPEDSIIINAPNPFYEVSREVFWVIIIAVLFLLVIVCFLGFNMIARREGEMRIKNQLAFQETLIDTVPQLVSWKDVDGRYMGGNSSYAEFFGLGEKSSVINENTKAVISDKNYAQWSIDADRQVVEDDSELRRIRKKIIDVSGAVYWLEVNKVPLRDQKNKITGVLTTAEDVTREQSLENQLLQSQKMEAIGTLAGGIAHDFNNILTSIINSTELAITDVEQGSLTEKDLARVLKAARRGGHVVKQILAFSKSTQEGFVSTDLGAVVTEVLQLLEVSLPSNVLVRSYIDTELENVHADPTQIHQVVMNLCTNAFQALENKGGELTISLDKVDLDNEQATILDVKEGAFVRLAVQDNGVGLSPDMVGKIFEPFFSLKDKSQGTGLGLSVVHGIVKSHHGGIKVESEVGVGTIFEVLLPYIASCSMSQARSLGKGSKRTGRILFVEDNPEQLITTPRILRSFGYTVDPVGDPKEAVAKVVAHPEGYDLVITDYDMPKLNGVEMLQIISTWAPDLPALIVSGREEALVASQNCESVKKVMVKPYEKNEMNDAIISILNEEKENE